MTTDINKELSGIFHEMASIYRYKGPKERFRVLAYGKASRVISSLPQDVTSYIHEGVLEKIPGIGKSIEEKILEYVDKGSIVKFEKLKKSVPYELMGMMDISGFGPQSLKRLHSRLKITSKEEMEQAITSGTIAKVKGFKQKKIENMLRGLKLHKIVEQRILLWDAMETGEKIIQWFRELNEVKQAEVAGSLRRKKETIGDLDIVLCCEDKHRNLIVDRFVKAGFVERLLAKGMTKASVLIKNPSIQVDVRLVNEQEFGSALQYFTGSKEHNIHLRNIARDKGYKLSEYGIFSIKTGKKLAGKSENEIYKLMGLSAIPPEMREDKGEIELALQHKLPHLITDDAIKGDLHVHSNWSDGLYSISAIAAYVKKNFNYEYIVLTDHSKSSRIAGGLDETEILKQIDEIERINLGLGSDFIKAGIEVDILQNGSLDISDEILSRLDWVTASVHSNLNMDCTERVIRACEHPNVHCISHPTSRLIGKRNPIKIDALKVIEAALETHTALEINAQCDRMDLNDELARLACSKGVKLAIGTDAHSLMHFHFMTLGVSIARRAWCTSGDILNAYTWKQLNTMIKKKKTTKKELQPTY